MIYQKGNPNQKFEYHSELQYYCADNSGHLCGIGKIESKQVKLCLITPKGYDVLNISIDIKPFPDCSFSIKVVWINY